MYNPYKTDDRPTLPSIGRIFVDGSQPVPVAPVYRRPSLTLPPLDNGVAWRVEDFQTRQYAYQDYSTPQRDDYYRMPYNMIQHQRQHRDRYSPDSDPGRDALSSASSYSSSSSPYDTRMPYRPNSAPHLGAYRTTPSYHLASAGSPYYPSRPAASAARHQCTYCNKRFNRPSGLNIHLTTHTGAKPYVCPEASCGRAFSVRSNMRRHVRIVHQLTREGSSEPLDASESS